MNKNISLQVKSSSSPLFDPNSLHWARSTFNCKRSQLSTFISPREEIFFQVLNDFFYKILKPLPSVQPGRKHIFATFCYSPINKNMYSESKINKLLRERERERDAFPFLPCNECLLIIYSSPDGTRTLNVHSRETA